MAMRLPFFPMRDRFEEDPDPDEEPEPEEAPAATGAGTLVPSVADDHREFEYRTEVLTAAEVVDGTTLPSKLTTASADNWDLVDIVPAGDRHAVLFRRVKRPERTARPVGFTPRPL